MTSIETIAQAQQDQANFLEALAHQVAALQQTQQQTKLTALLAPDSPPREGNYPSGAGIVPAGTSSPGQTNFLADGTVTAAAISDGAVGLSSFGSGLRPVAIVSSLPALPSGSYPSGSIVVLTTNGFLYRTNGTSWTAVVNTTDLSGTITSTQIADGSISTPKLQANSVTAAQILGGTITAAQIASNTITAGQIATGTITSSQIAASTILAGNIAANTITSGQINVHADIYAYAFRGSYGLFFDFGSPDAAGSSSSRIYGVRSNGYNVFRSQVPWDCEWGLVAPNNGGPATDALALANAQLNGALYVDTLNHRIYFRYGGSWHYVNRTAGFEVPVHETVCPVCGQPLLPGQDLIGRGDRLNPDGALHALYIHFTCAGKPTNATIADDYYAVMDHPDLDGDQAARATHGALVDRLTRRGRTAQGLSPVPAASNPPQPPVRPKEGPSPDPSRSGKP